MTEVILSIISAVVILTGTFFALVKSGHIQMGKKENGLGPRMDFLETHFNHETESGFLRIETAIKDGFKGIENKLDKISEDVIIVKTKQNNK